MPATPRVWYLGKDCVFDFAEESPGTGKVENKDVRDVTVTEEPGATARLTTRGSGEREEEVAIRTKTKIEVMVTDHSLAHRAIGQVTASRVPTGPTQDLSGKYQLFSISEPQMLDNEIVWTLTFNRYVNS